MARKSDRCGEGGKGTPPAHLVRRLKAYDNMSSGKGRGLSFDDKAFHRPGSNKK